MVPSHDSGRLIVVSNRLPVSVQATSKHEYEYHASSGGLIAGFRGLKRAKQSFLWYGWPGIPVPPEDTQQVRKELEEKHGCRPVFLEEDLASRYYDGFSNSTVWPLFHHEMDKVSFDHHATDAYRKVNKQFAESLLVDAKDGDTIWVQDYHLMLLPEEIRTRAKQAGLDNVKVGFFLHTPFPDENFLTMLPSKSEILDGILGADVVGFHTDEHRRHFLNCCSEIIGLCSCDSQIEHNGRKVTVGTYPIGIEPRDFHDRLGKEEVQTSMRNMREHFGNRKIILGVDRLDYIKGIPQKLNAYEEFLTRHPEHEGDTVLVQVCVPSRTNLESNQKLRIEVQGLVGEINGRHGNINYTPIHFLYRSIALDDLTALYAIADVCFICSTRDGMNLVSYEYIACHGEQAKKASTEPIGSGVVLLSSNCGSVTTLKGCLIINPWDQDECADSLQQAVNMDEDEAATRMNKANNVVQERTSLAWAHSFLEALR